MYYYIIMYSLYYPKSPSLTTTPRTNWVNRAFNSSRLPCPYISHGLFHIAAS